MSISRKIILQIKRAQQHFSIDIAITGITGIGCDY
jgi:hypothetical protein